MTTPLRCLLVEDSADDADLIVCRLRDGGYDVQAERVETAEGLESALRDGSWDIVLADDRLPQFSGTAALRAVQASGLDLPFILVSGTVGEDAAVAAMKAGAHDYVMKNRLERLASAVGRELGEAVVRRERRRAENLVRLQTAGLDAAANAILITDREGRIEWVNPAFTALTGYASSEALGRIPRELVKSGREPAARYAELWGTILAGRVWRGELVNRRKDGTLYHEEQSITPVRDAAGAITHFIAIKQDLTARKQAEEAQRRSAEQYRLFFESNPLPMWLHDLETARFLAVNRAAVRHYGFSADEFLAMTLADIRPADEHVPAPTAPARPAAGHTEERRHRRKDGSVIRVELTSTALEFNGRSACLVLASDVTEKRQPEEKLIHAQRLESLGMLAAGIAHDLNNALAPIIVAAPLLRAGLQSPREAKILETIQRSAAHGADLVKQLVGFVRSTTSEFALTAVEPVLRDLARIVADTFPESIHLEVDLAPDLHPVQGNATQLRQVLLNLCVNARDAMPAGGTLALRAVNVRRASSATAGAPGDAPRDWLRIEVSDSGTGMRPEVLAAIWTPFHTTKPAGQGTGLGLYTVRTLVDRHQGFIELETAVGRGSTFRVFLPAAAPVPALEPSAGPAA